MKSKTLSPFHRGEQMIQQRLGVRDTMERFGSKVIRNFMPPQHQQFYTQLPYLFVGHVADDGWPWASMICNQDDVTEGFVQSPDERKLMLNTVPFAADPLGENLKSDQRLGFLGIDLSSRRRNRLSATVDKVSNRGFSVHVDQAFGNCPQYIQSRSLAKRTCYERPSSHRFDTLDDEAKKLIGRADTFFVSSYVGSGQRQDLNSVSEAVEGVDISHRGGQPGFVMVDDNTLHIPDFPGNNHFNTLGNFAENPKAGLLFIDFEKGHMLQLTGYVEIHWQRDHQRHFDNAERFWSFHLHQGLWLFNTLPFTFELDEISPNSLLSGTWKQAKEKQINEQYRNSWREFEVEKVIDESATIRSFYLKPVAGELHDFQAGQFLTLKGKIDQQEVIRTYTVSTAPGENSYRISVKKQGLFSNYLHHQVKSGSRLQCKAPQGQFVFEAKLEKPAVLVAGGIGITPMIAMIRHMLFEATRTRHARPIQLIACVSNESERVFYQELQQLEENSHGFLSVVWVLSRPEQYLDIGKHYHFRGRLDKQIISQLKLDPSAGFYLCGAAEFMQNSYQLLRDQSVPDENIFAESFGPASLVRDQPLLATNIASNALVLVYNDQGERLLEQQWSDQDGSLLEFMETHGLQPNSGCRSGKCGTCAANLKSGSVAYSSDTIDVARNEVLVCCAMPETISSDELPQITLQLKAPG